MFFALLVIASLDGFTPVAKTDRADYFVSRAGMEVGGRSCEVFLRKTEQVLAVYTPRFEYYRVWSATEVLQYGGRYADGLASRKLMRIVAVEKCSKHEIVHLAAFQLGSPTSFWHEGVATTLAEDFSRLDRWRTRRVVRKSAMTMHQAVTIMEEVQNHTGGSDPRAPLVYRIAHAFTRFLVQKYGMWRIRAFFRACHSPHNTSDAFRSVYGMTQDEAWSLWLHGHPVPPQ